MFKSTQSRNIRRSNCLYGTVGTIPIVAMLVATQPAQAVLLSNASNTVSLCSGVQLPRSDITSALITPLSQIVSPLEATTNGLLSNVNTPTTSKARNTLVAVLVHFYVQVAHTIILQPRAQIYRFTLLCVALHLAQKQFPTIVNSILHLEQRFQTIRIRDLLRLRCGY